VVKETLVFQIKASGKSPALRVAANRFVLEKHASLESIDKICIFEL